MQLSKIFYEVETYAIEMRCDDCNNIGNNELEFLFYDEKFTNKYIHKCNVCNSTYNLDKKYPCVVFNYIQNEKILEFKQ